MQQYIFFFKQNEEYCRLCGLLVTFFSPSRMRNIVVLVKTLCRSSRQGQTWPGGVSQWVNTNKKTPGIALLSIGMEEGIGQSTLMNYREILFQFFFFTAILRGQTLCFVNTHETIFKVCVHCPPLKPYCHSCSSFCLWSKILVNKINSFSKIKAPVGTCQWRFKWLVFGCKVTTWNAKLNLS